MTDTIMTDATPIISPPILRESSYASALKTKILKTERIKEGRRKLELLFETPSNVTPNQIIEGVTTATKTTVDKCLFSVNKDTRKKDRHYYNIILANENQRRNLLANGLSVGGHFVRPRIPSPRVRHPPAIRAYIPNFPVECEEIHLEESLKKAGAKCLNVRPRILQGTNLRIRGWLAFCDPSTERPNTITFENQKLAVVWPSNNNNNESSTNNNKSTSNNNNKNTSKNNNNDNNYNNNKNNKRNTNSNSNENDKNDSNSNNNNNKNDVNNSFNDKMGKQVTPSSNSSPPKKEDAPPCPPAEGPSRQAGQGRQAKQLFSLGAPSKVRETLYTLFDDGKMTSYYSRKSTSNCEQKQANTCQKVNQRHRK